MAKLMGILTEVGYELGQDHESELKNQFTMKLGEFAQKVKQFEALGKRLYEMGNLTDIAKQLEDIANNAEAYTMQETAGGEGRENWFDGVTVKRNMNELKKYVQDFKKLAKEATTFNQRMTALYEDAGRVLGRYFEIGETIPDYAQQQGTQDEPGKIANAIPGEKLSVGEEDDEELAEEKPKDRDWTRAEVGKVMKNVKRPELPQPKPKFTSPKPTTKQPKDEMKLSEIGGKFECANCGEKFGNMKSYSEHVDMCNDNPLGKGGHEELTETSESKKYMFQQKLKAAREKNAPEKPVFTSPKNVVKQPSAIQKEGVCPKCLKEKCMCDELKTMREQLKAISLKEQHFKMNKRHMNQQEIYVATRNLETQRSLRESIIKKLQVLAEDVNSDYPKEDWVKLPVPKLRYEQGKEFEKDLKKKGFKVLRKDWKERTGNQQEFCEFFVKKDEFNGANDYATRNYAQYDTGDSI